LVPSRPSELEDWHRPLVLRPQHVVRRNRALLPFTLEFEKRPIIGRFPTLLLPHRDLCGRKAAADASLPFPSLGKTFPSNSLVDTSSTFHKLATNPRCACVHETTRQPSSPSPWISLPKAVSHALSTTSSPAGSYCKYPAIKKAVLRLSLLVNQGQHQSESSGRRLSDSP